MAEDMPPAWMWPLPEALDDWFEEVAARHKEQYGGGDSGRDEEVPMMQNELARGRR